MATYTPNRWHNNIGSPAPHLQRQYSTPRAWYRRSVMVPNITNSESSHYSAERYITAAAIVDRGSRIMQALVESVPWAVIIFFPGRDHNIVLVSCADRQAWANAARIAGARAWFVLSEETGQVYQYQPPVEGEEAYNPQRLGAKRGSKGLNHEEVREEMLRGYYNDAQLAEKYRVTRQTISNIRKKFGMRQAPKKPVRLGRPPTRQTTDEIPLDPTFD